MGVNASEPIFKVNGHHVTVSAAKFVSGGAPSYRLYDVATGGHFRTLSTNLSNEDMEKLGLGEFFYKTHDGIPAIIDELVGQGALDLVPGIEVKSGFATYKVARWTAASGVVR